MLEKEWIEEFQKFLLSKSWYLKPGNRLIAFQAEKGNCIATFQKENASSKHFDQNIKGRKEAKKLINEFKKTRNLN